ncbi:molybdopterin-dependent oxidoreductase [Streptacidiphilus jiangxiensis]|uniref:molybdopterin-dependent oxidoreductase n=1 Tax=Streptacidiphilus jiangxiensis TaxID=235985 RepID=UPI001F3DC305|nr:molybdopterin-dependent oxidoreductase [Streptacidiphilus jiangxiensis]
MNVLRTAVTGAAIGLGAAAAALAVGDLVAAFTGPASAPVLSVGSAAIDLTPTPLKDWAVQHFGTHDKTVLLSGIYATMALLAVAAGVLALRRLWAGVAVFALFAGLGMWAAASRDAALLPSALAGLAGAGVLVLLVRLARPGSTRRREPGGPQRTGASANVAVPRPEGPPLPGAAPSAEAGPSLVGPPLAGTPRATEATPPTGTHKPAGPAPRGMGRRGFLVALAATVAGAAVAETAARALTAARYNVAKARAALRLPAPVAALPPVPAAVHPPVAGLSAFTTPNGDFFRVDTALTLPQVPPSTWRLRVHGMVDHPVELSFDDLLRRPLHELDYTLSCVSNEVGGPYVGTARWLGASLPDLLRAAGVQRGAQQLVGRSADGMTIGTPIDLLLDGRPALLAVGMNGEPLPVAHGFPCRSLVPGLYGYTSATKWLVDLEITTFAALDPYWVHRGWDRTGLVRTASRIEVPAPFAQVPAGPVTVAGTAWATHRGVAAVEVRDDGGPWQEARLAADLGPDTWRQWSWTWDATGQGPHTLEVRATDGTGAVQPQTRNPPFPAGATGWHSTVVTVT